MKKNGGLSYAVEVTGLLTGAAISLSLAGWITYSVRHSIAAALVAALLVLLLTWPVLATQIRETPHDGEAPASSAEAARRFALAVCLAAVTPAWIVVLTARNLRRRPDASPGGTR